MLARAVKLPPYRQPWPPDPFVSQPRPPCACGGELFWRKLGSDRIVCLACEPCPLPRTSVVWYFATEVAA